MITTNRAIRPAQGRLVPVLVALVLTLAAAAPAAAQVEDDAIFTFFKAEKLEYQRDKADGRFDPHPGGSPA